MAAITITPDRERQANEPPAPLPPSFVPTRRGPLAFALRPGHHCGRGYSALIMAAPTSAGPTPALSTESAHYSFLTLGDDKDPRSTSCSA